MTDISIAFYCKNEKLSEHYKESFEKAFQELGRHFIDQCQLLMAHEAHRQEHYDYYSESGQRQVKYNPSGGPKLLYPTLGIEIYTSDS